MHPQPASAVNVTNYFWLWKGLYGRQRYFGYLVEGFFVKPLQSTKVTVSKLKFIHQHLIYNRL